MLNAERIKRFYIGGYQNLTQESKQAITDMFSDIFFFFPAYRSMQLHSK